MKPPSYWRDRLCVEVIINIKEAGYIENFVKEIQDDAFACWQPIETAPRDGTFVDLWNGKSRFTACYWLNDQTASYTATDISGWEHLETGSVYPEPTHWMPVPNKP